MADVCDLLLEIGTEELPPSALQRLSVAFEKGFAEQLAQHGLAYSRIEPFATPRRLALLVRGLAAAEADQEILRKGPAVKAAFDSEGKPTKAAQGFADSVGVPVQALQTEETSKGAWLVFRQRQPGRATRDLLIEMSAKALDGLPIPKRMRWGSGSAEFVRPVHWVALVLDGEPVAGRLFGIEAGNTTRGHRFHSPGTLPVESAGAYAQLLRTRGKVEPSYRKRRATIRNQVEALAREVGGEAVIKEDLLDEVTGLCEWPCAILGAFDEGFLEVPPEVLIETMEKHQKYFPILGPSRQLLPRFITVSNIESHDPSQVRAGNERVIRPRFADAAFFWNQDLRTPLGDLAAKLKAVVFQEKLGTLADKCARVGQISRHIAALLGADEELAARAAALSKCDLMTKMIMEFPSLQGIMGRYYAERAGEDPCVVAAMEEQYLPRYAGDRLPISDCGRILSLADKLDTLVGIFAIGQRPTGVKDPYALRRAAIGLLRILIETPLGLDLKEILEFTANELRDKLEARGAAEEVFAYCMERLQAYYQDRGIDGDVVDAVLAVKPQVPSDIHRRILAVEAFRLLPEAQALAAANKRIRNILRKNAEDAGEEVALAALEEEAERRLHTRISELAALLSPLLANQDYQGVLFGLAGLREDVDHFFDHILVMAEEPALRRNRLALLQSVEALFLKVADISLLSPRS